MTYLLDTNIIIRFLIWDWWELFEKSKKIFGQIEDEKIYVEILDCIVSECVYVLESFYEQSRSVISENLKKMIILNWVINDNKLELIEALSLYENKNIDFVDALIVSTCNIWNYKSLSFDKKLNKLIK